MKIFAAGAGINSAISISKTKKITAKMKNCKEKGIRADERGSNPHSKGVIFSKLLDVRMFNRNVAAAIATGNTSATIIIRSIKEMTIS